MEKISSLLYFLCTGLTPRDSRNPGKPIDSHRVQGQFWDEIAQLDGLAFPGRLSGRPAEAGFWHCSDTDAGPITIRVQRHSEREICMPLTMGADCSRAWLLQRDRTGLRLRHERRLEGRPLSGFGGRTFAPGGHLRQDFGTDRETQALIPEATHDTWSLQLLPEKRLTYEWRRPSPRRRLHVEFDLGRPVPDVE